ncbi:heterokaryon incompatibility protein-domain-containing protein [Triangularia verruculosa]|uniref:Heterokaryon incompatibility protein-domain-containing protein n=1 Tax=Triangularia verruculosa TaxID=2587418 RepID=A0AAN6XDD6_9PEZI|nr:heterokaryon incompatibility protein-domain-containing protein [Triangularia verruculosa]
MLCRPCHEILAHVKQWGYHRRDYHNAEQDADVNTCAFCSQLRVDGLPENSYPPYRWTLRWLPGTREAQNCICVTFRAIEDTEGTPEADGRGTRFTPPKLFYLFPKESLPVPPSLPLSTHVDNGPDGALPQIQSWLRECASHARCKRSSHSTFLPTRLIDVSSAPSHVHVVLTGSLPRNERYMTLSHCWGKNPIVMLTHERLAKFTDPGRGIPWTQLSKTFQDAIMVVQRLGVRYLWIDSLCIIQKSASGHGDFALEGQLMHLVYKNSWCNVAAADSKDGAGGLFRGFEGERATERKVPDLVSTADGQEWWVLRGDFWSQEVLDKILYTRGWVFQERMLSPRVLHFSRTQVMWDCATISAAEVLPAGLPLPLDTVAATERHWRERLLLMSEEGEDLAASLVGTADNSLAGFWKAAVRNYTRCLLTNYSQDRLKAFWGVAKLIRDGLRQEKQARGSKHLTGEEEYDDTESEAEEYDGQEQSGIPAGNEQDDQEDRLKDDDPEEEYVLGLWLNSLSKQLCWSTVAPEKAKRPDALAHFPSWSWASTIGEIDLQDNLPGIRGYEIEIASKPEVETVDVNTQPILQSNQLRLRGTVINGDWVQVNDSWMVKTDAVAIENINKFDFYPDVTPGLNTGVEKCCLVVILAHKNLNTIELNYDEHQDREEHVGYADELDGQSDSEQSFKGIGAKSKAHELHDYNGCGLVLQRQQNHAYKRIGAFRFADLPEEALKELVKEETMETIRLE